MNIIAVTACPTSIAHTYMAAEALQKAAALGLKIKFETQGAMGMENSLTARNIASADLVLIATDIDIEQEERFLSCHIHRMSLETVLLDAQALLRSLPRPS